MKKLLLAGTLALGLTFGVVSGVDAKYDKSVTVEAVYFDEFTTGELFLTDSVPVIVTDSEIKEHNVKLVYGYTYEITYKDATAQEILSIKLKLK